MGIEGRKEVCRASILSGSLGKLIAARTRSLRANAIQRRGLIPAGAAKIGSMQKSLSFLNCASSMNEFFYRPFHEIFDSLQQRYPYLEPSDELWLRIGIERVLEQAPTGRVLSPLPRVSNYFESLRHLAVNDYPQENDMHVLKRLKPKGLRHGVPKGKRVLLVYDRAGIDFGFWKRSRKECAVYFLSRVKEGMLFDWLWSALWDRKDPRNAGVSDDGGCRRGRT